MGDIRGLYIVFGAFLSVFKLWQLGLQNQIGLSNLKSDDEFGCRLNNDQIFKDEIGFQLKPVSIKTTIWNKVGLFQLKWSIYVNFRSNSSIFNLKHLFLIKFNI